LGTTASGAEVDVVIANDNSGVESTVNQFVTDYNSLISAINTQEGMTAPALPSLSSARHAQPAAATALRKPERGEPERLSEFGLVDRRRHACPAP